MVTDSHKILLLSETWKRRAKKGNVINGNVATDYNKGNAVTDSDRKHSIPYVYVARLGARTRLTRLTTFVWFINHFYFKL